MRRGKILWEVDKKCSDSNITMIRPKLYHRFLSPCEVALAETNATAYNSLEKRLWLEKGAVRGLREIPQCETFAGSQCVIKIPDSEVEDVFGSLLWAEDQRDFTAFKK